MTFAPARTDAPNAGQCEYLAFPDFAIAHYIREARLRNCALDKPSGGSVGVWRDLLLYGGSLGLLALATGLSIFLLPRPPPCRSLNGKCLLNCLFDVYRARRIGVWSFRRFFRHGVSFYPKISRSQSLRRGGRVGFKKMAQNIQIPLLRARHSRALSACGYLSVTDERLLEHLKPLSKRSIVFASSSDQWVRVFDGRGEARNHVHIDIARREKFSAMPDTQGSEEQFQSIMGHFFGQEIAVFIEAEFVIREREIAKNSLIKTGIIQLTVGELQIQQVGSELVFEGAGSLRRLRWKRPRSGKQKSQSTDEPPNLLVELELSKTFAVGPDYLNQVYQAAEESFFRIAFGGLEHVQSRTS
jgi:hypothetical protein